MLGVTLVATACDFGSSSSTSEISQSSSSEVSTQSTPLTSFDITSSSTSSNSTSSVSSSSTSSVIIPTLTGISLNTDNVKKEYTYGENLSLAGLVVTASYSNNTTTEVTGYTSNPGDGSELKTVGENDVTITYEGKTASFKITVSKLLTGIELNTENVKKEYAYNDNLDLTCLVVTAKYNDNSTAVVNEYTTDPANGAALTNLGENTVTVTYQEKIASFKITVTKVLTGIELDTTNVKKEYGYNEALDLTGLVVTAKYNDNSTIVVTDYTTNPVNGTLLTTVGDNTITVTYQEKTATFKISVIKSLTGIDIDVENVKTEYYCNDELDLSGLVVKAKYDDNSVEAVTEYTTDPANGTVLDTLGEHTVKVTYGTFTKEFKINVERKLTGIKVEAKGAQKIFYQGQTFQVWGLYVDAFYNDGFITSVGDYTTDPAVGTVLDAVGKVTVTVSYYGFTDTYEITVEPALVPETGNKLVLDLSNEPDFSIAGLSAYVDARGTTPNSDYFQQFYLYRNSNAEGSMTIVNSKLRVMAGDVIRNADSLHGVTAITVNGGNGNFRLYAGYTEDEMYEFLEAESNGGDRIYTDVPNVNYIKLVGKYDNYPADISSIEFTYTRDANNQVVDGTKSTVDLSNNQGTYTKGTNTIVIENDIIKFNDVIYTFTGIIYKQANLFFADANGNLLLVTLTNANQINVKDPTNAYSSANGAYDKTIPATKITLKIDGLETEFNSADNREPLRTGESLEVSASSDAYPVEDVAITLVDETNTGEVDAFVGTYTPKATMTIMDYFTGDENDLTINPIVVTKENGKYYMQYSDVAVGDYPGFSGKFEAFISQKTKVVTYQDDLTITIDTEKKTIDLNYSDEDYTYFKEGSIGYNFVSSNKPTASLVNGTVTALNAGNFYLDFKTSNGLEEKYYFSVTTYVDAIIEVCVDPVEMKVGETYQIDATVNDDATNKTMTFTSEDESIVTVTQTGLVTAIKEGTTSIRIATRDDFVDIDFTVTSGATSVIKTTYTFDDDNGDTHTVVVTEGTSLTIDDAYSFTYNSGLYVYDADEDIIVEIRISGSQAYLGYVDEDMTLFGYYGPIVVFSDNEIFLTFVSSETNTPEDDPTPVVNVKEYLFEDQDGGTHTLVVKEELEATLDDDYHFTYSNGHYVYDDDEDCYFDIRHAGQDLLDYYDTNMTIFGYYNYIVVTYTEEGTFDLILVD